MTRLSSSPLLLHSDVPASYTMAKSLSILLLLIIGTISSSFAFSFIVKPGSSKRISNKNHCSSVLTKMTVSTSTIDVAKQTTPNNKVIKAVIFDMDGTLLDTVS